ncbi:MAG: glycosyltransferase [Anaerolineae bacterium]|jgi:1,2-diacylglycerol 3-beta-galactosyltransferase|nr:glycosyltransferase [Anaerolineae bacterium]MBT7188995.1 glycosyltransferase [Anaerolineae bacterium]MBT7990262.1 glycosyltransferase [Anaerolineae bacterium]
MKTKKPHILFLFSDTGGGHRSSTESIIEALHLEFGDSITTEMVDFLKGGAPLPFNKMPDWYPEMVKAPHLWGLSFKISDSRLRARAITASMWPYIGKAAKQLVENHPADLVVAVHALATTSFLKALGDERPPFVTVVTDMVSTHALWYDARSDLTLVPTQMARERALKYGMSAERLRVVGQPLPERCAVPSGTKAELREKFGWGQDEFIALLVGGGDRMGPIEDTVQAINDSGLYIGLIVVTGRNKELKAKLEAKDWNIPIYIYGFTKDLPDFMRATDVLITKAGPGTIAESLAAHLPLILFSRLPGQEDGNVTFVQETETGVWAPNPQDVVRTLARWMTHPNTREKVVENCKKAAKPEASRTIARIIGERLGLTKE